MGPLTTLDSARDLPRWFATTFSILQRLRSGRLDVVLPDGRVFRVDGTSPGPAAVLNVHNPALFTRLVRDGEMGFPEAYLDGWWSTPDLQALLDLLLDSNDEIGRAMPGLAIVRLYERARHWLRSNHKAQAARNIAHHYDLGNDFYGRWLDPSMTYSSALFKTGQEDLEAGQFQKYEAICQSIGAPEGGHVLEIGCGWGGFAEHAAKHHGWRVTGLTISREQHDFAKARLQREGLADKVDIVIRDYRDERGRYDGIASIEMFEAVGEKYWSTYFDTVRDCLNPGARAGLQIITVADNLFETYRKGVDFIQKYIFPGGMLPSRTALSASVRRAGLEQTSMLEFGDSYSETLRRWRADFNDAWDEIVTMGFDDRFHRMWNFYLASCAACFRSGTTDVIQVGLRREV